MTRALFTFEKGRLSGFEISGHTGFAQAGSDILCAAVTSAVRMTECSLNTVLGINAHFAVDSDNASISCSLPSDLSPAAEEISQTILVPLMVYLTELQEEFPENIDIIEKI